MLGIGWILGWVVACSRGPTLQQVEPKEVHAGEPLRIRGEGLEGQVSAALVTLQGANYPLERLRSSAESVEGEVPLYTTPGTYDVVVSVDGVSTGIEAGVQVLRPRSEIPCTGEYTANTHISVPKNQVTIDRFHRDGTRETLRIDGGEVAAVHYEYRTLEVGECWVIYLVKADGTKVVFDDDPKVDLRDRAQKMARDLDKPLEDITAPR